MSTGRVLVLTNEDVGRPVGGLSVHIWQTAMAIRGQVEQVIVSQPSDHRGRLESVGDDVSECSREEWYTRPERFRILYVSEHNESNVVEPLASYYQIQLNITSNVLAMLGQEQFNAIHVQDAVLWPAARVLQQHYRCPVIFSMHLGYKFTMPPSLSPTYRLGVQVEGNALHGCDRVLTVSDAYRDRIVDEYFVPEEKIVVIPNGVSVPQITPVKYRQRSAVFVGRFVPTKGLDILLDAIPRCRDWQWDLYSVLAPTMEDNNRAVARLDRMVRKYDNVRWHKEHSQGEKWAAMASATVGLVPSIHEPFGIVALEWMTLEVPLITTGVDGLADFCRHDTATMIEPTGRALAEALRDFRHDAQQVHRAREMAARYTWSETARRTAEVYEEVADAVHMH